MKLEPLLLGFLTWLWESRRVTYQPTCGSCDQSFLSDLHLIQNKLDHLEREVEELDEAKPCVATLFTTLDSKYVFGIAGVFVLLVLTIVYLLLTRRNAAHPRRHGKGMVESPARGLCPCVVQ